MATINKIVQDLPKDRIKEITRDIDRTGTGYEELDFLKIAEDNNKKVVKILKTKIRGVTKVDGDNYVDLPCPTLASEKL